MTSKFKKERQARPDKNQPRIVAKLRQMGIKVLTGHDDILVEYKGQLLQIELKSKSVYKKDGSIAKGVLRDNQVKELLSKRQTYAVCSNFSQCFDFIRGIEPKEKGYLTPAKYRQLMHKEVWKKC